MRKGTLVTTAALGFLLGTTGYAVAQQNARTGYKANKADTTQAQPLSDSDKDAIKMLHQADQVEMEMGFIAKSNAGSKDVKDYGRMLEQDHNKNDKQLMAFAKERQMQLLMPKSGSEQKAEAKDLDELRHLKGDAFDQKFLQMMVDAHSKKIDEVQKKMNDVKDPQLKSMMQETLPVLKHHRDMAQSLLQKKAG